MLKTCLTVSELAKLVEGLPPSAAVVVVLDCGRHHGAYWTRAAIEDNPRASYSRGVVRGLSDALGLRMFPPDPEETGGAPGAANGR